MAICCTFLDIIGSKSINSDLFRIIIGQNTPHTYKMMTECHYASKLEVILIEQVA